MLIMTVIISGERLWPTSPPPLCTPPIVTIQETRFSVCLCEACRFLSLLYVQKCSLGSFYGKQKTKHSTTWVCGVRLNFSHANIIIVLLSLYEAKLFIALEILIALGYIRACFSSYRFVCTSPTAPAPIPPYLEVHTWGLRL